MREKSVVKEKWIAGWNGGKTGPTCPFHPCAGDVFYTPIGPGMETRAIAVSENSEEEATRYANLIAAAPALLKELENQPCPHQGRMPLGTNVAECCEAGNCGCGNATVLAQAYGEVER